MFARIAPMITLTLVVVGLGCPSVPAPLSDKAKPVATVQLGEPDVLALSDAGVVSPPQATVAQTLFEREVLPKESSDTTDYKAMGKKLLDDKRGLEAVGALRVALASDSTPEVWAMLGEAYLVAGDDARGTSCLEEAVARDPAFVAARKTLAKRYLVQNDGVRARSHADELVRQEPTDAGARQILGRALMQQKMWKEAIAAFELVVNEEPDNIFAHNNIGYSALQVGSLELAREHLERCLSLEPQQGYMLNNLGVAYERLGRAAEAHASFSRAAELSPRYAQAQLNRDRLQAGMSQEDRIVSAETLMHFREPGILDGAVNGAVPAALDSDGNSTRGGDNAVEEAVRAATGGSARLAPLDTGSDAQEP